MKFDEKYIAYGLNDSQVAQSRRENGANMLTPPAKQSAWSKFWAEFSDPLIIILCFAGGLSILISLYEYFGLHQGATVFFEPIGIFMAIFLATVLSFYFENKADKEFAILNQVNDDEPVKVMRNGALVEVPKRDVVVGDVVHIAAGDEVPADGHLAEAMTLVMDESTLTGEPTCDKTTDPAKFNKDATYPSNYVLRGTKVMEGRGIMVVDKVGDATENGKVYVEAQIDDSVKTPLDEQFERLGRVISICSYVVGALIIVGRCIVYFANCEFEWMSFTAYLLQTVMIAVTLVVVSVPEGLPMAVTLSLAYSMRRMLQTNNLVRKLHACETMGATTVICTDKTGTLTQNQMQVYKANFYGLPNESELSDNEESKIIEEGIAVNSTAALDLTGEKPKTIGNPTEGALLLWLHKQRIDYQQLQHNAKHIAEIPFSTERKYMASIVISSVTGRPMLYVKGAPEIVCAKCKNIAGGVSRNEIDAQLLAYQQQAMRTLGFAYQELDNADNVIIDKQLHADNLTFLGIVAISDPVRADVPAAVDEVTNAGINVKIVTGDTPGTAKEIGRQIGLWTDADTDKNIITGPQFAALSDSELNDRVLDLKIISRARPNDKKRLVEALQKQNQVVAVTGDGTNDAPALKAAHVGLSMGDGTSVAKEASDITIIDNSFSSIGRAVMWGRSLYQNIQRFILFQLTVNVVACLIVLSGAFLGTELPLTVTQMLWVNLIMDTFAAMALSTLPPSREVMRDRPRDRNAFIVTKAMYGNIFSVGMSLFVVLFAILVVFEHTEITSLPDLLHARWGQGTGLSAYELSLFFTIFVFFQFWNLFNARAFATGRSAFHLSKCGEFVLIVSMIFVGQILIVTFGRGFFNVVPLRFTDWLIIIAFTSIVLWVGEIMRRVKSPSHNVR